MRKLGVILGMALMAVMVVGAGLAQADATWNFNSTVGDLGSSPVTFLDTTSTIGITAYGYTTDNGPTNFGGTPTWGPGGSFTNDTGLITAHNLWGKSDGPGEEGLGLKGLPLGANIPSNEIQFNSFIQLDLLNVKTARFTSMSMGIGSMQAGEGFYLWGSNVQGTPGLLLGSALGGDVFTFELPSFDTYRYFSISATPIINGDSSDIVILNGLSSGFNPVPLPPSVLLFGSGLLGLVGWRRFRQG